MPQALAMPTREFIEQNSEAVTETGCWIWAKCIAPMGYGQFHKNGKVIYAHRASYEAFKGSIPAGLHVLHSCDVRACVNPLHLRAGTNQDNIMDSVIRGTRKRAYKPRPYAVGKTWNLKPETCEGRRKIKISMYAEIFELKKQGWTAVNIATKYNVTDSLIGKILKGSKHD